MSQKRLALVEGQHREDKLLDTLDKHTTINTTNNDINKIKTIDWSKEKHTIETSEIMFMTTVRLTGSQHDTLLAYLRDNTYTTLIYNSDRFHRDFINDVLDTGVNVHDHKTGTMLTTRTPQSVLDKTLDIMSDHYRTERITELGLKWHGGRPPLGFRAAEGELVEVQWFEQIRATLKAVQQGEITQSGAAEELDCTRKTVAKCLDNPERYRI